MAKKINAGIRRKEEKGKKEANTMIERRILEECSWYSREILIDRCVNQSELHKKNV